MRKLLLSLCLLAALAPALGAAADPAAADTSATFSSIYSARYGHGQNCTAVPNHVFYSSVRGWYNDGCTARVRCMSYTVDGCSIHADTDFGSEPGRMVSQNSRLRRINSAGSVYLFHDSSCYQPQACGTVNNWEIRHGETATIQCNGVVYGTARPIYYPYNTCKIYAMAQ